MEFLFIILIFSCFNSSIILLIYQIFCQVSDFQLKLELVNLWIKQQIQQSNQKNNNAHHNNHLNLLLHKLITIYFLYSPRLVIIIATSTSIINIINRDQRYYMHRFIYLLCLYYTPPTLFSQLTITINNLYSPINYLQQLYHYNRNWGS